MLSFCEVLMGRVSVCGVAFLLSLQAKQVGFKGGDVKPAGQHQVVQGSRGQEEGMRVPLSRLICVYVLVPRSQVTGYANH